MKLRDVNTTDIGGAIRAGCRTMASVFNADDNDVPFFGSQVWPDPHLAFSSVHSESHVPGRHLNALLTAESLGFAIDEAAVEKHAHAAFFSYGGPLPLPLNRERMDGPLENFRPHNVREGFHALYALAGFRDSERAREVAETALPPSTGCGTRPGLGGRSNRPGARRQLSPPGTFITGLGRAIGPLVKYYRATGSGPALELAVLLKEKAVEEYFLADGSYDTERFGEHTHSTTCVMSSLAQLADLLTDAPLMERPFVLRARSPGNPRRTRVGDREQRAGRSAGSRRSQQHGRHPGNRAYPGSLGLHRGLRRRRTHPARTLLPSQLRDSSWIEEPANPGGEDGRRDVAKRHWGAFGFPAPYGHHPIGLPRIAFNMDIVGGAVASLCEAYREATRRDSAGHRVNLLFDHETDEIKVESPYTGPDLGVTLKQPGSLFVRIPAWADASELSVSGCAERPLPTGRYLLFANPPVGTPLTFRLELPTSELSLRHRMRDIRVRLRGDEVVAMDNFGQGLAFFDALA